MPLSSTPKPNKNVFLLTLAFTSFFTFTCLQTIFAILGNSQSMLGDCATMFIDSLTYCLNMIAEQKKNGSWKGCNNFLKEGNHTLNSSSPLSPSSSPSSTSSSSSSSTTSSLTKIQLLQYELLAPSCSVFTMLIATAYIFYTAYSTLDTLLFHVDPNAPTTDDTNIRYMLVFSSLNLLLDFGNIAAFAKERHGCGYKINNYEYSDIEDIESNFRKEPVSDDERDKPLSSTLSKIYNSSLKDDEDENKTNMNMCSAYTHVFADTLRSIAILGAALIAYITDIPGDVADAVAAIVVSCIIFVSTFPLIVGLVRTWKKWVSLKRIERREEKNRNVAIELVARGGDCI